MSPRFCRFNVQFVFLLILALSYTIVYFYIRFKSAKAFTEWNLIPPAAFYATFAIESGLTIWLFTFVFQAKQNKTSPSDDNYLRERTIDHHIRTVKPARSTLLEDSITGYKKKDTFGLSE